MFAFEMFGGLDGELLAITVRARRTINRDFKPRVDNFKRHGLNEEDAKNLFEA